MRDGYEACENRACCTAPNPENVCQADDECGGREDGLAERVTSVHCEADQVGYEYETAQDIDRRDYSEDAAEERQRPDDTGARQRVGAPGGEDSDDDSRQEGRLERALLGLYRQGWRAEVQIGSCADNHDGYMDSGDGDAPRLRRERASRGLDARKGWSAFPWCGV